MSARLCIELHDVAPATWPACERILALVESLGRPPLTLLAVPNYHGSGSFERSPHVIMALQRRRDAGDEIALHGYWHRDDAPPPRTPAAWLRRRVLTDGEGEFAALSAAEASRRIWRGLDDLGRWFAPIRGFVAPAWLNNAGAWQALRDSPLDYAATRGELILLDGMCRIAAPAITASTRSRQRRLLSRLWLSAAPRLAAKAPLLRLALHPADAAHPDVLEQWRRVLQHFLSCRTPLTKARALDLLSQP